MKNYLISISDADAEKHFRLYIDDDKLKSEGNLTPDDAAKIFFDNVGKDIAKFIKGGQDV